MHLFRGQGFNLVSHVLVNQRFAENHQEYFKKISTRTLSSLQSVSDQDFTEGLLRFRVYCQGQNTGASVYEEIDLFIFQLADS